MFLLSADPFPQHSGFMFVTVVVHFNSSIYFIPMYGHIVALKNLIEWINEMTKSIEKKCLEDEARKWAMEANSSIEWSHQ